MNANGKRADVRRADTDPVRTTSYSAPLSTKKDTTKVRFRGVSCREETHPAAVLYQCNLLPDFELFEAGDLTEVGEKGQTLSGGQKARITLARAIYSTADILLLDDVLAALDVHTARWMVEKCFKGDLVRGRTVILVTHNVALTRSVATFVVSLSSDGQIASQGSVSDALAKNKTLAHEVEEDIQLIEKSEADVDEETSVPPPEKPKPSGKLVMAEEVAVGHVSWSACAFCILLPLPPY